MNGKTQYGLVRFATSGAAANTDGPLLSGTAFPVNPVSVTPGEVRVAWLANEDRDNANLTYKLYRGSTAHLDDHAAASNLWWNRPLLTFTDTGQTAGKS